MILSSAAESAALLTSTGFANHLRVISVSSFVLKRFARVTVAFIPQMASFSHSMKI
jgi:hypothetical protein